MNKYRVERRDEKTGSWYVVETFCELAHAVREYEYVKTYLGYKADVRVIAVIVHYSTLLDKEKTIYSEDNN
jgi:hypothetical protein